MGLNSGELIFGPSMLESSALLEQEFIINAYSQFVMSEGPDRHEGLRRGNEPDPSEVVCIRVIAVIVSDLSTAQNYLGRERHTTKVQIVSNLQFPLKLNSIQFAHKNGRLVFLDHL